MSWYRIQQVLEHARTDSSNAEAIFLHLYFETENSSRFGPLRRVVLDYFRDANPHLDPTALAECMQGIYDMGSEA